MKALTLVLATLALVFSVLAFKEARSNKRELSAINVHLMGLGEASRARHQDNFEPDSISFFTADSIFFGSRVEIENAFGDIETFIFPRTVKPDSGSRTVLVKSPRLLRNGYAITVHAINGEKYRFVLSERGVPYADGKPQDFLIGHNDLTECTFPELVIFSTGERYFPEGYKPETCRS